MQQYHYGALRNNSNRLFQKLGPDIGCDSIGDWSVAVPMSKLFSRLDEEGKLAKTIIYPIDPRDNALVGAMIGNFQDGTVAGKCSLAVDGGSTIRWTEMIKTNRGSFSAWSCYLGLLGCRTDPRSFLSFTRHEYFSSNSMQQIRHRN